MSDSVRLHRWQPTRLPRPWDSPGKNTGVGCHFLLQCMQVKSQREVAQSCPTLSDPMDCSLPVSSIHGIFQARVLEWGAIAFSVFFPRCHHKLLACFLPSFKAWLKCNLSQTSFLFIYFLLLENTPFSFTLQYYNGFCHTSTWIGHRYTYVPSLLNLPPFSFPVPPL